MSKKTPWKYWDEKRSYWWGECPGCGFMHLRDIADGKQECIEWCDCGLGFKKTFQRVEKGTAVIWEEGMVDCEMLYSNGCCDECPEFGVTPAGVVDVFSESGI